MNIENVLQNAGVELSGDITEKIIEDIIDYTSKTAAIKPILNLSDLDRYELNSKIISCQRRYVDQTDTRNRK